MKNQFDQIPPCNIDAERCLLGSMILDRDTIPGVLAIVDRKSFYQEDHAIIFDALSSLYERNIAIDAVTLRNELAKSSKLNEIGGVAYLGQILGSVPSSAHGEHYARIVREKATLRSILKICADGERTVNAIGPVGDGSTEITQAIIGKLVALTSSSASTQSSPISEAAADAYWQMTEGKGLSLVKTGIEEIDREIGGIALGEELIIGARPSMGKSTIGRQIALCAARLGTPVAMISLEESRTKIARNLISSIASIENDRLRRGEIQSYEWPMIVDGVSKLSALPIYIADRAFTMSAIRAVTAMLVARYGVKLIIVDYLQKIQIEGRDRYEQVTNASTSVSTLIKELNVAGVVLAQLKREVAQRSDKRPGMSDLRESGQVEQDADQILLLHREDYYRATGEGSGDADGVAELIKAKVRDGCRGGTIYLKSNLKYQRFDPPDVPEVS